MFAGETYLDPNRSTQLPDAWSRNTVNTSIFRNGLVSNNDCQFGSYYESDTSIVVFKRSFDSPNNVYVNRIAVSANIADAHNVVSIGLDFRGFVHLSFDQHKTSLKYLRSLEPHSIDAWTEPLPMTGLAEECVSYPYFIPPRKGIGKLLFIYRDGTAENADIRLKMYSERDSTWSDLPWALISGRGNACHQLGPYINHPAVDENGNIHVFYTWRGPLIGKDSVLNNRNIEYCKSSDGGLSWLASNAVPLHLPVTAANGETVFGTPPGSGLMNQCGATVDSKGRPFAVFYQADGPTHLNLIWHNGRQWVRRVLRLPLRALKLRGRGTLQLPLSRPDVIMDRDDNAWIILRVGGAENGLRAIKVPGPDYNFAAARHFILWRGPLSHYEPIIDRNVGSGTGILSMLLQQTAQGPNERTVESSDQPVFLVDWNLMRSGTAQREAEVA